MISGKNDNLGHVAQMLGAQFFDHLVAIFPGHGQVDDHHIRIAVTDGTNSFLAIGSFHNVIAFGFKTGAQGQSNSAFIINDQYPGLVARRPRLGLRRPLRRD